MATHDLGLNGSFMHTRIQDQSINPPTHVQATFILQTPHNRFQFTPVRSRFRPVINSSSTPDTIQRRIAAIISSDDEDQHDPEPSRPQQQPPRAKTSKAQDIWSFFRHDTKTATNICILCEYVCISFYDSRLSKLIDIKYRAQAVHIPDFSVTKYAVGTSTYGLRKHLCNNHLDEWAKQCKEKKLVIGGEEARAIVADYWRQRGEMVDGANSSQSNQARLSFTAENFIQAILKFVVSDDQVHIILQTQIYYQLIKFLQALNILENKSFRALLLLLRDNLNDSDIPHRSFLRTRIMSTWNQHLEDLRHELTVRFILTQLISILTWVLKV